MASYDQIIYPMDEKCSIVDVPLKIATEENTKGYGRFVPDFDREEVWIENWPKQGWREMTPGFGNQAGVAEGDYCYEWQGDMLFGRNKAVGLALYVARAMNAERTHAVCWEANYHPDGGQVFFPRSGTPFVALLALPGDDVKPDDFVGFYFDGSRGFQLKPNVWHQPMLPCVDSADFKNKQGRIFACVTVDTVKEFNSFMRVPMKRELASE